MSKGRKNITAAFVLGALCFTSLLLSILFSRDTLATDSSQQYQLPGNKTAIISTANPHASLAGWEILKAGGSAVDAAIAAQLVLGLVEPQSSGIGGGGFLLHYDNANRLIESFDGRETAPKAVTADLYRRSDGQLMNWHQAASGGLSVGVPGLLRMLELAHQKHGKVPWRRLFKPAIDLAENGFLVTDRLATLIKNNSDLVNFPAAKAYLYKNGTPIKAGALLKNTAYAATLRNISKDGADIFYVGEIADRIVHVVRSHQSNPGLMSSEDIAAYRAYERPPTCSSYRVYTICGMGPPSSGGITTLQILSMLEHFDLSKEKPNSLKSIHVFSEASKLAFADRAMFIADSDFFDVPIKGLINKTYLLERAKSINLNQSMGKAIAGTPPGSTTQNSAAYDSKHGKSTTHLSIIDADGNMVSFTSSIERAFGSRLMAKGFFLNNQLTDFSFSQQKDGQLIANRIEPGKRPRSSMSPVLVFSSDGSPMLALGSPGGSRIIGYVSLALVALLDWKLDPQATTSLPHHLNRNGPTELEINTNLETLVPALEGLGHKIKIVRLNSGLHIVKQSSKGLQGGADPRREGIVISR